VVRKKRHIHGLGRDKWCAWGQRLGNVKKKNLASHALGGRLKFRTGGQLLTKDRKTLVHFGQVEPYPESEGRPDLCSVDAGKKVRDGGRPRIRDSKRKERVACPKSRLEHKKGGVGTVEAQWLASCPQNKESSQPRGQSL